MPANEALLQQAWDTYYAIAASEDRRVSLQSLSDEEAVTPYDHATNMVKALIRVVYPTYDPSLIWTWFGESGECLSRETIERALADHYTARY
ncbi:hypothetical protein SEA_SLIMJIMMY_148 [Mycobacterium phage SlimJimmy]|nr:hypothetical protein SEA_SLIMJIMMY_148 [Mycobacterium phage SlimJimmy]